LEHKAKAVPGFTAKYGVDRLVRFGPHASFEAAIRREAQIKEWRGNWKISLIEQGYPRWTELFQTLSP
jgi:putative endonuclease